jgi:hypothetical protein
MIPFIRLQRVLAAVRKRDVPMLIKHDRSWRAGQESSASPPLRRPPTGGAMGQESETIIGDYSLASGLSPQRRASSLYIGLLCRLT